ncbi:MAG: hypothetical protein A2359_04300 [Candidatus Moranbacteria bacterium RIFOXYB1_FULL_43_19]|nr:MAG: hypothetical protein A2359_04300 [Candidatus Moranbacteria bacterium RIFOXYB1_FULL_43_19]OGI32875.1 MAG: hypothetical protein A2420_04455 [Candidatus Moranbacteria bacterium RIFOXYC1_FULL_44_13]OGI37355.1 MAG: hypothetical protein A2612_00585 [Candidatus Moranbacteria bacterium RIFOXYD1_FULL_44_12]
MADFNLKMIKIFFLVVIAMLILAMTSGMNILRSDNFFNWQKVKMEANFLKYKRALAAQGENSGGEASRGGLKYTKSVPVLLYHGIITDRDWKEDGTNITLDIFEGQMLALKKSGYHTINLSEFSEYMQGKRDLPEKSILITFDDGRKDSYYQADPIFRALGFNAVMFAIVGRSLGEKSEGDNFYLGRQELKDMLKSGRWEVQSHGDFDHNWMPIDEANDQGHFMSNLLWLPKENRVEKPEEAKKRILADLENSKKKIEDELGQKVIAFAYPFNDYGQSGKNFPEAQQFLAENISRIYPLTFFQEEIREPLANSPDPQRYMIKRINVDSGIKTEELFDILDDNREKALPWQDTFWEDHGWRVKWGETKIWGDLTISEKKPLDGNMTILLGSSRWENYFFKSRIYLTDGNSISQVARYQDDKNYARCNFDAGEVSISQKISGQDSVLASKPGNFSGISDSDREIGAELKGNSISCYLDGQKEIEGNLDSSLSFGGVGFYLWDDLPQNAAARIKKMDVAPI